MFSIANRELVQHFKTTLVRSKRTDPGWALANNSATPGSILSCKSFSTSLVCIANTDSVTDDIKYCRRIFYICQSKTNLASKRHTL